jgi:hypothetical protein
MIGRPFWLVAIILDGSVRGREAVSVVVVDSIGGGVLDYKRRPFRYLDNLKKKIELFGLGG